MMILFVYSQRVKFFPTNMLISQRGRTTKIELEQIFYYSISRVTFGWPLAFVDSRL